jgi:ubiquinone/menaquinone biosynthesis C-methylase UbiE
VVGVDVSGEMIRQARALNPGLKNVEFVEGSGVDLRGIEDESFDAALSYIVFQHIPSRQIVYGYIREVLRVLKPGGCFVFQARNDFAHRWTGTYAGDSVVVSDVVNVARSHGRDAQVLKGEGTQYCYFLIGPRVSG